MQPTTCPRVAGRGLDIESEPFSITRSTHGAVEVVTLEGELDMSTAQEVAETLDELAAARNPIVVDLTALAFIDSSGIHALLRPRPDEASIELVCPPGNVRRVLEVTKLEQVLPVHDTLDDALAATA
jgi:anti-sigma B factor antagonist